MNEQCLISQNTRSLDLKEARKISRNNKEQRTTMNSNKAQTKAQNCNILWLPREDLKPQLYLPGCLMCYWYYWVNNTAQQLLKADVSLQNLMWISKNSRDNGSKCLDLLTFRWSKEFAWTTGNSQTLWAVYWCIMFWLYFESALQWVWSSSIKMCFTLFNLNRDSNDDVKEQ